MWTGLCARLPCALQTKDGVDSETPVCLIDLHVAGGKDSAGGAQPRACWLQTMPLSQIHPQECTRSCRSWIPNHNRPALP